MQVDIVITPYSLLDTSLKISKLYWHTLILEMIVCMGIGVLSLLIQGGERPTINLAPWIGTLLQISGPRVQPSGESCHKVTPPPPPLE